MKDYSINAINHLKNPLNTGIINNNNTIEKFYSNFNMYIKLYADIDRDTQIIKELKFKAQGNTAVISTLSFVSEKIKNKNLNDLKNFNVNEILDYFQFKDLSSSTSIETLMILKNFSDFCQNNLATNEVSKTKKLKMK